MLRKLAPWLIAVFAVLLIAAISMPNLLRSRFAADEALQIGRLRSYGGSKQSTQDAGSQPEKKLIRKAELELQVDDLPESASRLRQIATTYHGDIDQVRLVTAAFAPANGELHFRLPADQLETALSEFKKIAVRVAHEQIDVTDVTHQWTDNDARLRNLKAEEQQYLQILKQAGSIQDTLAVTEKLTDVRGRIEQLQGEINLMNHDIAMSTVGILLVPTSRPSGLLAGWHPLAGSHDAVASMLTGVSNWVGFVVGACILLPAILLWTSTVVAAFFILYGMTKLFRRSPKSAA